MTMSLQDHVLTGTPVTDAYIVDAHAHMGPYYAFMVGDDGSPAAMVRWMDRLGIDVSIVSPHIAITCDWREGNRHAYAAAEQFGLAFADVGSRCNTAEFLLKPIDDNRPRRLGKRGQLGQIVVRNPPPLSQIHPHKYSPLLTDLQLLSDFFQLIRSLKK